MEHQLSIDGESFAFQPGETLLEVARRHGKEIPTLCHDPRLKPAGACRTCLVEVQGARRLMPACATSASNGAVVTTANARIERHRTSLLSLYLTDHPGAATMETRRRPDQLLDMATRFGAATDWAPLESRRMGRSADRNPYIDFDPAACILCARCTRYCDEVESVSAITLAGRASQTTIATADNRSLLDTSCEMCGGCIDTCPTGAMAEKRPIVRAEKHERELTKVRTTCNFCGVGCQLDLNVDPDANELAAAWLRSPPRAGRNHQRRQPVRQRPLRLRLHPPRRPLDDAARARSAGRDWSWPPGKKLWPAPPPASPPCAIATAPTPSASFPRRAARSKKTTWFQKSHGSPWARTTCTSAPRHDTAPTVAGLVTTFGAGAMTNSIGEIRDADFLFVIGSNTSEAHPIIAMEMKRAVHRGATMVVADPRRIFMAGMAEKHLQIHPGSDVWLLNAMAHVIIAEDLVDHAFIEQHTENFDAVKAAVASYTPEAAEEHTGVSAEDIRWTARKYATTDRAGIYYTLGITEHSHGTDNVYALANLVLMTGHLGKPSSGMNPLRARTTCRARTTPGRRRCSIPGTSRWSTKPCAASTKPPGACPCPPPRA
ncbi:MAG: molybdopterin-dependent oxidoreductase [Planctomycetota bacterium]